MSNVEETIITDNIQDGIDKAKNEESNRSLSIAIGDGHNLIAVSELDRRHWANDKPNRYVFLVTKPGVEDTHVCVAFYESDIRALIGILQGIIAIGPFEE